ncbi:MAG: hypothetical protein HY584_04705 [Candidatus Omnitrophica bacterium]|nr:hypothetical protein [Candidatus Omnitrophota bacterium]
MQRNKTFFLTLVLICFVIAARAQAATVTNNGNITVRVQYKTPDGQYEDLGYVKPGETVDVPGGVEKVRIVRDPGEWAQPLKPGEILEVEVKEGDKTTGKMTWYGDKVFFVELTEGSPPIVAMGPVTHAEPVKEEPKPETKTEVKTEPTPETKPEDKPTEQPTTWPWYGGPWDFFFPFMLVIMWPFLILMWFRHFMRPGYYIQGEWVEAPRLGWGWGWRHYGENGGGMPCGMFGILAGLVFGLALGGMALWGQSYAANGDGYGFFPLFKKDLYSFPIFIFQFLPWSYLGQPDALFIFLFWVILCTLFGGIGGLAPFKWLYGAPCIVAVVIFLLFMRGCSCAAPFAFDGGYDGGALYPPAFGTLFFLPILFEAFFDLVDPYYELYEEEEEDPWCAFKDFFRGNPLPLLSFLAFWFGGAGLGLGYAYGWGGANGDGFARPFHDLPLMLGLNFLPPVLVIIMFWMFVSGTIVSSFCAGRQRFLFYSSLIAAFLALVFLMGGDYPQRQLDFYRPQVSYEFRHPYVDLQVPKEEIGFQYVDEFRRALGSGSSEVSGRELQVDQRERRQIRYEW